MTRPIDDSHDPGLTSWVDSANQAGTDFPIQNLPFGVFRRRGASEQERIGVAIGDRVLDLRACGELRLLAELPRNVREACAARVLNPLMALGVSAAAGLRHQLVAILKSDSRRAEPMALVAVADAEMLLPAVIGNYTDFYASIFHATNVGRLFRPENPVLANYKYVPIAYHGRASSVVISGTPISRPSGQTRPASASEPAFGPTCALDYELEVAAFVGPGNALGQPVRLNDAEDHIFGLCLLNDWSARDIQVWESQPLGPFLSKSFASSISPWVVTMEALAPFRSPAFLRGADDPQPLPYLSSLANERGGGIDLRLEVALRTAKMREAGVEPVVLSRSTLRDMYWTVGQMLTHHTSNGCNLCPGDVIGSGTVSGPTHDARGCLLEISRQGKDRLTFPTGEQRSYLADGDEVIFRGYCERAGYARIGFGTCQGLIV